MSKLNVWKEGYRIKDSKDIGYRSDLEIEIYEKGKEKKRIIIKNGKMIKKPDEIELLGEYVLDEFVVKGILKVS